MHPEDKARQRVLEAINTRSIADFSGLASTERTLSAEFLQELLAGAGDDSNALSCPLRICGANITGPLLPPTGSARNERTALQFADCDFDAPVDMSGAKFLVLRFLDCRLPAFIGASLNVSADIDLSGSQFSGVSDYESELSQVGSCAVHLSNARIGGKLDMSSSATSRFATTCVIRLDGARIEGDVNLGGALLNGDGGPALSARSATVGGNINLSPAAGYRCETSGEVAFVAAQVTGDLSCESARLVNPGGRALHCEDLKVESVFLTRDDETGLPFEACGRLNFLTAIVDGSFFMTNARLSPGPDYRGLLQKGGPIALNLQQARIANALGLNNVGAIDEASGLASLQGEPTPVRGWFLLAGAEITSILDDVNTGWPAPGFLDLDGATYSRIRYIGGSDLTGRRLRWLRRQFPDEVPDAASFRPQPYEQLSRVLQQHGLTREANEIAVEKIRMRLAARVDKPWARVFPRILMLISHYGYSSSRAVLSFLVFVLLGSVMYATAVFGFGQPFLPIENSPEPVTYLFAFDLLQHATERGCPGFDVMSFALDAALPVIDVGQDAYCRFTPEGPGRGFWLLLHSLYVVTGAALSAVVVLTLTGVLRQD